MNLHVAQDARLLLGGLLCVHYRKTGSCPMSESGRGMALQALQVNVAVLQHMRVCPSVRDVASRASCYFYGGVLEHKGSLLVRMALEADGVPGRRGSDLPYQMIRLPDSACSVRIMAVGALDEALIHAMVKRHIELRLLHQMAGIAKLGLCFHQQIILGLRMVGRMAGGAAHVTLPMERIDDVPVLGRGRVASQAARVDVLSGSLFEKEEL